MTSSSHECPVCYRESQLRMTPCGNRHCFCLDCLKTLADSSSQSGQFPCPMCRQPIKKTAEDVSDFPVYEPIILPRMMDSPTKFSNLRVSRSYSTVYRPQRATTPERHPKQTTSKIAYSDLLQQIQGRSLKTPRNISAQINQRVQELEERDGRFFKNLQCEVDGGISRLRDDDASIGRERPCSAAPGGGLTLLDSSHKGVPLQRHPHTESLGREGSPPSASRLTLSGSKSRPNDVQSQRYPQASSLGREGRPPSAQRLTLSGSKSRPNDVQSQRYPQASSLRKEGRPPSAQRLTLLESKTEPNDVQRQRSQQAVSLGQQRHMSAPRLRAGLDVRKGPKLAIQALKARQVLAERDQLVTRSHQSNIRRGQP